MKSAPVVLLLALFATACGSDSNPNGPTPPTTTTIPQAVTHTLSGVVMSSTGSTITGATVRVADGANAGRSATTTAGGVFTLANLQPSGFTLNATALNYQPSGVGVNLTSDQNVTVTLTPTPLFQRSGIGDSVFDIPTSVSRIRIQAEPTTSCQNFAVNIAGRLVVNVILGTCSVADARTHDGTYVTSGGTAQITISSGVRWVFTEIR